MSSINKKLLSFALVVIAAVMLTLGGVCLSFAKSADTDKFTLLTNTEENGATTVAVSETGSGYSVSGAQANNYSAIVYDHAYNLGSKISFSYKVNFDDTDLINTNVDALKSKVYFAVAFAQASGATVSAMDFDVNRTGGNGAYMHLVTNSNDLRPQNRAMVNFSTFKHKDIINGDSVYSGLGDGANDLGWAFVNGEEVKVEIGSDDTNFYMQFSIDRPGRADTTVYKMTAPLTDLVQDDSNTGKYYVAIMLANGDGTSRNVDLTLSSVTAEEVKDPVDLSDTDTFVTSSQKGTSEVKITDGENGAIAVSGKQTNDSTVVVYDHSFALGSKVNFNLSTINDLTGTGKTTDLRYNTYFAVYFGTATKTEDGFDAKEFTRNRTSGNGMYLHLFTNVDDLYGQERAVINVSTFTNRDIVNGDSVYSGLGDAANDLGWAFVKGGDMAFEIGTENVGGVEKMYLQITVNRPGRGYENTYKVQLDADKFFDANDSRTSYYLAFEFANLDGTERTFGANVSAVTFEEIGLKITPENVFLKPGMTATLTAKNSATDEPVTGLSFVSADPQTATVDENGVVTGVKAGTTKILVTDKDGKKGEAYITVANNVTLNVSGKDLFVGQTFTLSATTNPKGLNVIWTSDNESVATVENGLISALSAGTANITVTVKNFESGDLLLKATAVINVTQYVQPADVRGENYDVLYTDGVIAGGNGASYEDGKFSYGGTIQNGKSYMVIAKDLSLGSALTFDFINNYDVSETNDNNHKKRFFGLSLIQNYNENTTAADLQLGAGNGLQIDLFANGSWYAWGGKFFMNYATSVSGSVTEARTPENTGSLTGTDRFANAFCRAFADGMRIQVKIVKEGDLLKVSFTPVFNEGDVPDGSENLTYPNGGQYDYIGPYTMTFNWSEVASSSGNFALAIGVGNNIDGTIDNVNYAIENLDTGVLHGVELSKTSYTMKKDATYKLTATFNPVTYVPSNAAWTSSDASVATVNAEGNVTALKGGKTTITYTADGQSASCEITVIAGLTVNENSVALKVGETFRIEAVADPVGAAITYASGNDKYATVSADGVITAVAEGQVTVYVRAGGGLYTQEISVNVTAAGSGESADTSESGKTSEQSGGCRGAMSGAGIVGAIGMILACAFVIGKRK